MTMINMNEKYTIFLNTNRMIARALCGAELAIMDGSSSGGHVMEASA